MDCDWLQVECNRLTCRIKEEKWLRKTMKMELDSIALQMEKLRQNGRHAALTSQILREKLLRQAQIKRNQQLTQIQTRLFNDQQIQEQLLTR